MATVNNQTHWLIRINDGVNFRNSVYPFWGVKRGRGGGMKTIVSKFKPNDVLWFITSKKYGGKIIGMAEYTDFYDRADEPLLQINTKTNIDQNWVGDGLWDIQIHYHNMYITEKQNITGCVQCTGNILKYETFKRQIDSDLYAHYNNFKLYSEPKVYSEA